MSLIKDTMNETNLWDSVRCSAFSGNGLFNTEPIRVESRRVASSNRHDQGTLRYYVELRLRLKLKSMRYRWKRKVITINTQYYYECPKSNYVPCPNLNERTGVKCIVCIVSGLPVMNTISCIYYVFLVVRREIFSSDCARTMCRFIYWDDIPSNRWVFFSLESCALVDFTAPGSNYNSLNHRSNPVVIRLFHCPIFVSFYFQCFFHR